MIGTFYHKPSPDKPNFVERGDVVSPGQSHLRYWNDETL